MVLCIIIKQIYFSDVTEELFDNTFGALFTYGYCHELINCFLCHADPRSSKWFLMSSPLPAILTVIIYLIVVIKGPKWMEKRPPFELRYVLISYNFCLVLLSVYMCYEVCQQCDRSFISLFAQSFICSFDKSISHFIDISTLWDICRLQMFVVNICPGIRFRFNHKCMACKSSQCDLLHLLLDV